MWNRIFQSLDSYQRSLSAGWLRDSVIRNNIANVETPRFKTSDVAFESLLLEAATEGDDDRLVGFRTHEKHFPINEDEKTRLEDVTPQVYTRRDLSMRMDENNVDIESENVKLAQNQLQYNTVMEKLNSEIRRLRMAINEGR